MSKIKYKIGEDSKASLIAKQIAFILEDEFINQIQLGNEILPNNVGFDYIGAIDAANYPFVGVLFAGSSMERSYTTHSHIESTYHIESKVEGYDKARKVAEVIRHILMHVDYRYLNLDKDFGIRNVEISQVDYNIFENRQSTGNYTSSYITVKVQHNENTHPIEGTELKTSSVIAKRNNDFMYYVNELNN